MAAEGDASRVADALRHPLRARVFYEYFRQTSSPSRVARRLGEPVNLVAYHTKVLRRLDCIRHVLVEEGGHSAHFYEAAIPPIIEDEEWQRVPVKLRRSYVRSVLGLIAEDVSRSAAHGGFDRSTVHVSRTPLYLDDEGLQELADLLRDLLDGVASIEARSAGRAGERATRELIIMAFDDLNPIAPV